MVSALQKTDGKDSIWKESLRNKRLDRNRNGHSLQCSGKMDGGNLTL